MTNSIGFGSDNHSGVHPEIMSALANINHDHVPSYGTDFVSERTRSVWTRHFGPGAEAFYVFNGTAANVLSLSACVKPGQAVICAESAHLNLDECAAPESVAGIKLVAVPTPDGKLRPGDILSQLIRRGDQHFAQVRMVSISQPTEYGTVYSLDEIKTISQICRNNRLLLHVDGARLVNAAETLGVSLGEMTSEVGVDVLSMGGTKNGLMFGEAVVFFHPELAADFKYTRKRLMQLPSKSRFIAAQFEAFLGTDLWRKNAAHANSMARLLADGVRPIPGVEITQKVDANAVFVKIPKAWVSPLREHYFFYVWNETTFECRLMCTWDTKPSTVEGFVSTLRAISDKERKK